MEETKEQALTPVEQGVTPKPTEVEPTVAPTAEQTVAPAQETGPKSEQEKQVSTGVQKRIDQVTAKYYAALDESKKTAERVKQLEEENARLKSSQDNGTPSIFDEDEGEEDERGKIRKLEEVVTQLQKEREENARTVRYNSFSEFIGEMREKYGEIGDEECIHIIEELNKDDVPPEAHGAIEKYFAAHEATILRSRLDERENRAERQQAVTEKGSLVSSEHFPDDPSEALKLLKENPSKYEELAKKAGLRK